MRTAHTICLLSLLWALAAARHLAADATATSAAGNSSLPAAPTTLQQANLTAAAATDKGQPVAFTPAQVVAAQEFKQAVGVNHSANASAITPPSVPAASACAFKDSTAVACGYALYWYQGGQLRHFSPAA